jgi:hypothetical protein
MGTSARDSVHNGQRQNVRCLVRDKMLVEKNKPTHYRAVGTGCGLERFVKIERAYCLNLGSQD